MAAVSRERDNAFAQWLTAYVEHLKALCEAARQGEAVQARGVERRGSR